MTSGLPMPRYRRRQPDPLDLLPPLAGLLALCIFFIPGFRQFLGALFWLVVMAAAVALIGLIAWKWLRPKQPTFSPSSPSSVPSRDVPGTGPRLNQLRVTRPNETWSLELLRQLEWKRFEDVVAAYIRELGQTARTTRIGPDGGVDVEVMDPATGRVVMLVQCKAWEAYKVGIKPVRELFGVMAAAKVNEGAFFTTGEFTQEAVVFAQQNHLDLVDGHEFIARIKQLPALAQANLQTVATAGDYTTPTCPSCGVKMVSRTASKGRAEGQEFWGCPNYPRGCKRTFAW